MNHSIQINAGIYFEVCGFWYMLTQLLNHVSKEQCSRGEYTKKRGPRWRKFIDRGLFGALKGRGPGRGQGLVLKKQTPCPVPLTGAGWEIGVGARRFLGSRRPVMNTMQDLLCLVDLYLVYLI